MLSYVDADGKPLPEDRLFRFRVPEDHEVRHRNDRG
jgi:hypothetical protein